MENTVLIGVSNRHVHLCRAHLDTLFGAGYNLTMLRTIRQPGQFAAEEKVTLVGDTELEARIVGPLRLQTQIEILQEDRALLGIDAPVKVSGKLEGTPGMHIRGPAGEVTLSYGVIVAAKHVHMATTEVPSFGLEGIKYVDVRTSTGTTFERIPVRSGDTHRSEFHLDRDEATGFGIATGHTGTIIHRYSQ